MRLVNRRGGAVVSSIALSLALVSCAGAGGGGGGGGGGAGGQATGGGGGAINVLMVGNPQMEDIQKLTADSFTKDTGIKVNFTILPENELRDKVTQDVATGAGQYDVVTVGAYEVPIWAKNDWLHEMSSYAEKDANFDSADLLKPITQVLSGEDTSAAFAHLSRADRTAILEILLDTKPEFPIAKKESAYAR